MQLVALSPELPADAGRQLHFLSIGFTHWSAERIWSLANSSALPFFRIKHYQWVLFFVAYLLVLRLVLALTHDAYLGIDGGAYALSALEVLGKNATSVGFPRPPLAPGWLLVPFVELFGLDVGYKIWTVLFSAFPLLPVYLLTRQLVNKSAAIFALAFFSVDMMQMEMMVTGSLPLIGFSLIGLSIWAIISLADRFSYRCFFTLVLSLGALPYVNQTSAGLALIVLPIITVCLFIFAPKDLGPQAAGPKQVNLLYHVLPAAFLGLIIALGAIPWYLANAPGNGELRYPGPLILFVKFPDPALVLQAPLIGFLVVALVRATKDYRMRSITVVMGVLGILMLFLSYDEAVINIFYRSRYLVAFLVYPAIAFLLCRTFPMLHSLKEEWTVIPMVAVWILLAWGQVFIFNAQTNFKDMIFPETVEALEIAADEHPQAAIITNAYSLSHWVAAINQVESPNTWSLQPSPFYVESDYHVRCLLGWIPGCSPRGSALKLDAKYILIDERMPDEIMAAPVYGAPTADTWAGMDQVPWLHLRKSSGSVKLWEILATKGRSLSYAYEWESENRIVGSQKPPY